MSDMSDLELVAQAMAPTENPAPKTSKSDSRSQVEVANSNGIRSTSTESFQRPPSSTSSDDVDPSEIQSLANLDPELLASLSLEDREALLPILEALQKAEAGLASGANGEDGDADSMAELLRVMNQAEAVADGLEDKLDRLIATLGEEAEGLKGAEVVEGEPGRQGEKVEEVVKKET